MSNLSEFETPKALLKHVLLATDKVAEKILFWMRFNPHADSHRFQFIMMHLAIISCYIDQLDLDTPGIDAPCH